ncbi:MFS transporter, YNFM family, putative membrane transport protein [Sporomusa malonica]|uniref:MFS transporter, YNFM family, putative membrane transport protein n=2 Tax=Sporomusa malonica TaxID=112901 RepID=A0A1W1YB83_9FIRM|nr:MFS transporter, YNFM family, putative membrane transport protein [Sporomusa malonica]
MAGALLSAAMLELAAAFSPSYEFLMVIRAIQGVALSGFPANAMAYVGEEFLPHQAGTFMGIYISGTAIGGMMGRLMAGWLTAWYSWQIAMIVLSIIAAFTAFWFILVLPRSQYRGREAGKTLGLFESLRCAVKGRRLLYLYICGFLIMGSFVAFFNYISYHLMAEPYQLSPAAIGSLFLLNIPGIMFAPIVGRLMVRYTPATILTLGIIVMVIGCVMTLATSFISILIGMIVLGTAFAANHATISSWVGRCANFDQAQAAAWYLTFYYAGSVVVGTAGGPFWSSYAWPGVVGMITVMLLVALGIIVCQHKFMVTDNG